MPRLPQNLNRPEIHSPTGDLVSSNFNMAGLSKGSSIDLRGVNRGFNAYINLRQKTEAENDRADASAFEAFRKMQENLMNERNAQSNSHIDVDISQNMYTNALKEWANGKDFNENYNARTQNLRNKLNGRMQAYQYQAKEVSDQRKFQIDRTNTLAKHDNTIKQSEETYDLSTIENEVQAKVDAGYLTPEEGVAHTKIHLRNSTIKQFKVLQHEDPIALQQSVQDDLDAINEHNKQKPEDKADKSDNKVTDGTTNDESTNNDDTSGAITNAGNPMDAELAKLEEKGRNRGETLVGNPDDEANDKMFKNARKGIKPSAGKAKSTDKSTDKATGKSTDKPANKPTNDYRHKLNFPHVTEQDLIDELDTVKTINAQNREYQLKLEAQTRRNIEFENLKALQALENNQKDGKSIKHEFTDVTEMLNNYNPTTLLGKENKQAQLKWLRNIKVGRIKDNEKHDNKFQDDAIAGIKLKYMNGVLTAVDAQDKFYNIKGLSAQDMLSFAKYIKHNKPFKVDEKLKPFMKGIEKQLRIAIWGNTDIMVGKGEKAHRITYNSDSPKNAALHLRKEKLLFKIFEFIDTAHPTLDQLHAKVKEITAETQKEFEKRDWHESHNSKFYIGK